MQVSPTTPNGDIPAKVAIGEVFSVYASIFQEGSNSSTAFVTLTHKSGREIKIEMKEVNKGRAIFEASTRLDLEGEWTYYIEAWANPLNDYEIAAKIKLENNIDVDLTIAEKEIVMQRLKKEPKPHYTKTKSYNIVVSRQLSLFSAWYQFFPRSEGAKMDKSGNIISGDFISASKSLKRVRDMGFDIIYLPPIHPIGSTNRKGKNNSLNANILKDPGSPWAVGNKDGGHMSVAKELGGIEAFRIFVKEANRLGLEVSLDFALQCSPDHPWVTKHPNWFKHRSDGSIQFAENPPKKYEDIYPIYFEEDFDSIVDETIKIMKYWISEGVRIFRVDNPHTKPVKFWNIVISEIKKFDSSVLFLSEAFTKPPMMLALGYAGFDQSHSYFLWRDTKDDILRYFNETQKNDGFFLRPTFWPTTPDNLTEFLVKGGEIAHKIRAILAATGTPSWGIYTGYEFVENEWDESRKEHNNNEKYEIKIRDWAKGDKYGIMSLFTKLNTIRKENESFQSMHNFKRHTSSSQKVVAYSKHTLKEFTKDKKPNDIFIIVNLDYSKPQTFNLTLKIKNLEEAGVNFPKTGIECVNLLDGKKYHLDKKTKFTLDPKIEQALILKRLY